MMRNITEERRSLDITCFTGRPHQVSETIVKLIKMIGQGQKKTCADGHDKT